MLQQFLIRVIFSDERIFRRYFIFIRYQGTFIRYQKQFLVEHSINLTYLLKRKNIGKVAINHPVQGMMVDTGAKVLTKMPQS